LNRIQRTMLTLLTLLILLGMFPGAAVADRQIVLSFLGDCTIGNEERLMNQDHSFAKVAAREGYAYFFANVKTLLTEDDLTIANFEGVLKSDHKRRSNKTYTFRGLPTYAQILRLGSVEAVSLANNHSMDYGALGYETTQYALGAAGVQYFDAATPYLFEKDGIRIGVLGIYAAGFYAKRKMMTEAVQSLRAQGVNAVVVMVHAGQEYATYHSRNQTLIAHLLIDAGADVVIGSHPHVLQGTEVYQQRTILYSAGNFVFGGNAKVRSLETVVARVTLTFGDTGTYLGQQLRLYPAHTSGDPVNNDYQPVLVSGDAADAVYQRIDQDSPTDLVITEQNDLYREYRYLPAQVNEEQP